MMETNDKFIILYKRYDKIDLTKNILEKKKQKLPCWIQRFLHYFG